MEIRRAVAADLDGINSLLRQVLEVHHAGRPDIFKGGAKKYTDEELLAILADDKTPVFVAVDENSAVMGYVFGIFQQHVANNILTDIKTLYIDDLCVDESRRGQHVGKALYEFAVDFARRAGCYNLTLNVWSCNQSALRFYERLGLRPQKIGMETILDK